MPDQVGHDMGEGGHDEGEGGHDGGEKGQDGGGVLGKSEKLRIFESLSVTDG